MNTVIILTISPLYDGTYFYDDGFYDAEYIREKIEAVLRSSFEVSKIKVINTDDIDSESKDA